MTYFPGEHNCLSLFVAKLDNITDPSLTYGQEVDVSAPGPVPFYTEWTELNTVGKVSVERNMVYDEGDVRIIYIDHVVTVEAVITQSMWLGDTIDGETDPRNHPVDDFNTRLERLAKLLSNQGLGINFMKYPSPIRRVLPSNEKRDYTSYKHPSYDGYKGWLVDNFNGPRTLSLNFDSIVGQEAVMMNWKVKYRTSHSHEDATTELLVPKISSEVRLDIGEDGDIRIIVDGTIYADSLEDLYKARDYIDIRYQADSYTPPRIGNVASDTFWVQDEWSVVNGFKKTVAFNVEKNGRSAKFNVTYSQIKSNNAYPLGIRDIEFDQTLESSLLAKHAFDGKAFRTWKNQFKCKITIPPRLTADYAWYVCHLLVSQQLRRSELKMKTARADNIQNQETNQKITKDEWVGNTWCIRFKATHKHYKREVTFEMDYVTTSTFEKIFHQTCFLSRLNNDYQRKLTNPAEQYAPYTLSQQWFAWNKSNDTSHGFDPTQPNARNPGRSRLPHRDTAGTEIFDTGHNYDPYKKLEDQDPQQVLFVTTVYDPNDYDPDYYDRAYNKNDPTLTDNVRSAVDAVQPDGGSRNYADPRNINPSSFGESSTYSEMSNNYTDGKPQSAAWQNFTVTNRLRPKVNPRVSWLHYHQDYTLHEVHKTIPTESLSDISVADYRYPAAERQKLRVDNDDGTADYPTSGDPEVSGEDLCASTGFHLHGRTTAPDRSPDDVEDPDWTDDEKTAWNKLPIRSRKTYAAAPSRFYVTVKGSAIRVGYKIPIPHVVKIAGKEAIRVGTGRMKHSNLAPDGDVPVYLAIWEQTYTVDKGVESADILASIEDTGASVLYV